MPKQVSWRKRKELDGPEEARALVQQRFGPSEDPIRQGLHRQWATNIAFLAGFQHHAWDMHARALVPPPSPVKFRPREVRNLIRPYHERRVSYYSSFRPRFRVRPNSSDPEDQLAADSNTKILDHYWTKSRTSSKGQLHAHWLGSTGNAFYKIWWNAQSGASWTDIQSDEEGMPHEERFYEGDVEIEVVSPFQMCFDPMANDRSQLEWCIQSALVPMEWVDRHFPDQVDEVSGGVDEGDRNWYEAMISGLWGPQGYSTAYDIGSFRRDEWAFRQEYWQVPTPEFPHGRYVLLCNNKVMGDPQGPNPTPDGQLPYVWSQDLVVPGRVWAQSIIDNLIQPQRNYNRIVSGYIGHILTTAYAKIIEPYAAGLDNAAFITEYGEKLRYSGNMPPGYLIPPPLPAESDTEMNRIKQDFDLISSSFGAARGQYQGKLSGTAISLLIEQDLKSKEPAIDRLAEDLGHVGELILQILQKNVTEPRTIKILGKNRSYEAREFMGQDIRNGTDVYIEVDSMMPKSKTLAMEELRALAPLGIINPMDPRDKIKVWEMLQRESDETLIQDKNLDRRYALIENRYMLQGMGLGPAQSFEDHDVHVLVHTEAMKGDDFRQMPPNVIKLFMQHLQSHYDIVYPQQGAGIQVGAPQGEEFAAEGPEGA